MARTKKVVEDVAPAAEAPVTKTKSTRAKKVNAEDAPVTKTRRTRTRTAKDPNAPKRPLNVYFRYCQRADVVAKTNDLPVTERAKARGVMYNAWKDNAANAKELAKLQSQYESEMKAWKVADEKYKASK